MRIPLAATLCAGLLLVGATAWAQPEYTECEMDFQLKGWSAFYKTASGEGRVRCKNGQRAAVALKTRGGGFTFGKQEITEGKGVFSKVTDIEEIFGTYASATAQAAVTEGGGATLLTKGEVSLAIMGKGRGFTVGVDFAGFTVSKKQ